MSDRDEEEEEEDPFDAYEGNLGPEELKELSSQLKRIAKVADEADNFAARLNQEWSVYAFNAQTFVRKLDEEFELTGDERMFVDAIRTCCGTVFKRFRVFNLHREEPNLPTPEKWTKEVLQPWLLTDLRRICIAYELRTADKQKRLLNIGSSRAACIASMLAFRKAQGHLKKVRKAP
eukprot:INCI17476.1.p1 GENE.INCI17476.1~~INCI17476.1.p1  ORF type:complete len:177 (+),score=31.54 INCI17476.1:147-677(+)